MQYHLNVSSTKSTLDKVEYCTCLNAPTIEIQLVYSDLQVKAHVDVDIFKSL